MNRRFHAFLGDLGTDSVSGDLEFGLCTVVLRNKTFTLSKIECEELIAGLEYFLREKESYKKKPSEEG